MLENNITDNNTSWSDYMREYGHEEYKLQEETEVRKRLEESPLKEFLKQEGVHTDETNSVISR